MAAVSELALGWVSEIAAGEEGAVEKEGQGWAADGAERGLSGLGSFGSGGPVIAASGGTVGGTQAFLPAANTALDGGG